MSEEEKALEFYRLKKEIDALQSSLAGLESKKQNMLNSLQKNHDTLKKLDRSQRLYQPKFEEVPTREELQQVCDDLCHTAAQLEQAEALFKRF